MAKSSSATPPRSDTSSTPSSSRRPTGPCRSHRSSTSPTRGSAPRCWSTTGGRTSTAGCWTCPRPPRSTSGSPASASSTPRSSLPRSDEPGPPGSLRRGMAVLAIDAGTTGVTALVVDEAGRVVGRGYREFPQRFPNPGWVEHDPEDWWTAALGSAGEALGAAEVRASALAAVGIANQRETTVIWDRETLRPVHPAIVWQDRRTAPLCEALWAEGWEERIAERTGLVVDPYFSGTKLAWLLEHVDGVREGAEA